MIKELTKIANELDNRGLVKEADVLDILIKKAHDDWGSPDKLNITQEEKELDPLDVLADRLSIESLSRSDVDQAMADNKPPIYLKEYNPERRISRTPYWDLVGNLKTLGFEVEPKDVYAILKALDQILYDEDLEWTDAMDDGASWAKQTADLADMKKMHETHGVGFRPAWPGEEPGGDNTDD